MDKEEYVRKVEELLEDKRVYKSIEVNPIKRLDNDISNQQRRTEDILRRNRFIHLNRTKVNKRKSIPAPHQ